jgi:hypothetical protein
MKSPLPNKYRADDDSKANAISVTLAPVEHAERADQVHECAIVALHDGHPVALQLLYPDLGVDAPIAAVASRYALDRGALEASAGSALAVPDRVVVFAPAV